MAIHHNQEQFGIPCYPFYFLRVDKEVLSDDDSAGKHGPPYGFPKRDPSFHGDEKEMRLPPKPKIGASAKYRK